MTQHANIVCNQVGHQLLCNYDPHTVGGFLSTTAQLWLLLWVLLILFFVLVVHR